MVNVNELIDSITAVLSEEKAYDLPVVCIKYGLETGEEDDAFRSKRVYVQKRLKGKEQAFLLDLAKRIIKDYGSTANTLSKVVNKLDPTGIYSINELTRRNILGELFKRGNIEGKLTLIDFLNRIWNLESMPSMDHRLDNALRDISQHMIINSDWDYQYLFETYLDLIFDTDEVFIRFLEQIVHPIIRDKSEQLEHIEIINYHLKKDGFHLLQAGHISGYPLFKTFKIQKGVKGSVKNLIFAAIGHKPEIVLVDSINNDIKIVNHEENCLVYDRPIPYVGLGWNDLVDWWKHTYPNETKAEISLYKRLYSSLDSPPEKMLFDSYFRLLKTKYDKDLPALIPQVYLHYDPYTLKNRMNGKVLPRQRMDFLILFSSKQRIVLELDGKQHYSDGNISSPKKYAEMVKADRDLKLNGYEVYRFGGFEFLKDEERLRMIESFFERLFVKYGVGEEL